MHCSGVLPEERAVFAFALCGASPSPWFIQRDIFLGGITHIDEGPLRGLEVLYQKNRPP